MKKNNTPTDALRRSSRVTKRTSSFGAERVERNSGEGSAARGKSSARRSTCQARKTTKKAREPAAAEARDEGNGSLQESGNDEVILDTIVVGGVQQSTEDDESDSDEAETTDKSASALAADEAVPDAAAQPDVDISETLAAALDHVPAGEYSFNEMIPFPRGLQINIVGLGDFSLPLTADAMSTITAHATRDKQLDDPRLSSDEVILPAYLVSDVTLDAQGQDLVDKLLFQACQRFNFPKELLWTSGVEFVMHGLYVVLGKSTSCLWHESSQTSADVAAMLVVFPGDETGRTDISGLSMTTLLPAFEKILIRPWARSGLVYNIRLKDGMSIDRALGEGYATELLEAHMTTLKHLRYSLSVWAQAAVMGSFSALIMLHIGDELLHEDGTAAEININVLMHLDKASYWKARMLQRVINASEAPDFGIADTGLGFRACLGVIRRDKVDEGDEWHLVWAVRFDGTPCMDMTDLDEPSRSIARPDEFAYGNSLCLIAAVMSDIAAAAFDAGGKIMLGCSGEDPLGPCADTVALQDGEHVMTHISPNAGDKAEDKAENNSN